MRQTNCATFTKSDQIFRIYRENKNKTNGQTDGQTDGHTNEQTPDS